MEHVETMPKPPLVTAWWQLTDATWIHITDLLDDPEMKLHLPLLDQLALDLELHGL